MTNPFFTLGYGGPEYFCDREAETTKLVEARKERHRREIFHRLQHLRPIPVIMA